MDNQITITLNGETVLELPINYDPSWELVEKLQDGYSAELIFKHKITNLYQSWKFNFTNSLGTK